MIEVHATPKCPKCRDVPLKKPSGRATPVLRCYTCHGMWVEPTEIENIVASKGLLDPDSLLPQRAAAADASAGLCPDGHGILTRARVEAKVGEPFYLERCAHCRGLWFDAGEWQRLAESHLLHHLEDLWDPEWQRQHRQRRAHQLNRQRLEDEIGDDVVKTLDRIADDLRDHPRESQAVAYLLDRLGQRTDDEGADET